jgi:hypothetical protein
MSCATLISPSNELRAEKASDFDAFLAELRHGGVHPALAFLNARTPHRFTGVFRFDGTMLRNVALVDNWDPAVRRGDDIPLAQAYCAVLHDGADSLEVLDSRTDGRFPQMTDSPIASYCGALIRDSEGEPWGALCHYDLQPCESKSSDMPLLTASAAALHPFLDAA